MIAYSHPPYYEPDPPEYADATSSGPYYVRAQVRHEPTVDELLEIIHALKKQPREDPNHIEWTRLGWEDVAPRMHEKRLKACERVPFNSQAKPRPPPNQFSYF